MIFISSVMIYIVDDVYNAYIHVYKLYTCVNGTITFHSKITKSVLSYFQGHWNPHIFFNSWLYHCQITKTFQPNNQQPFLLFFFNDLISECTQTPTEEMKRAGTELIRTLRSIGQPYMTLVFVVKQVTNYELHQLWIKQSSSIMAPHTVRWEQ